MSNVLMPSDVMLDALTVFVVVLNTIMLSVIILRVVILLVVAPTCFHLKVVELFVSFPAAVKLRYQVPYSQHSIFFVTYESAQ
jgi:hypothetical protein